jgi:hypothetical protein
MMRNLQRIGEISDRPGDGAKLSRRRYVHVLI